MSDNHLIPRSTVETEIQRFDLKLTEPFCQRSVSEETRRVYKAVTREFFEFFQFTHPSKLTTSDILRWRDHLNQQGKSASTVALKLSVVRSLFDYMLADGQVSTNPAETKLVPSPALPEALCGRMGRVSANDMHTYSGRGKNDKGNQTSFAQRAIADHSSGRADLKIPQSAASSSQSSERASRISRFLKKILFPIIT